MKQVEGASQADALAWLRSARDLCYADLYAFTLADGSVWRFTSADVPLSWGGETYRSRGMVIRREGFRTTLAVEVQTLALALVPDREDPSLATFVEALDFTPLRGARVTWRSWYGDTWAAPRFTVLEFAGRVSDVDDDEVTTVHFASDLALLNTRMPRNIYSSTCLWELYEPGCGISRTDRTDTLVVAGGATPLAIPLTGAPRLAGYYTGGGVRVASGPLAGHAASVQLHAAPGGAHVLRLATPLPAALAAGVTLSAWPGCDRTQDTCAAKFANLTRFRGMPYVPVPETAV